MTHEGTPASEQVAADWRNKIMHASMDVGDQQLIASDVPQKDSDKTQGFYISLQIKDPAEAERVFEALSKNKLICRSRKPSGPSALACWSTSSARLG
jgi:PhnB protein